jgi:hypothetical protein
MERNLVSERHGRASPNLLADLIRANGFDAGAGTYSAEEWLAMVEVQPTGPA